MKSKAVSMDLDKHLGSLAEEFHVASRNSGAYKHVFKAHQVHYEAHVQQLVATAPLKLNGLEKFPLEIPTLPLSMTVDQAITARVSGRAFEARPLRLSDLARILFLGNGVREAGGPKAFQRNVPNSGNLGSVELYPIVMNVEGLDPGIYHFDSVRHELTLLGRGQYRGWIRERVLYQLEFGEAAVALVSTSAVGRLVSKYGPRGYRFAFLDVGHVSENIYLVGTALGLQVCATAGFIDTELDAAIGVDGIDTASMLVHLVGPPASNSMER